MPARRKGADLGRRTTKATNMRNSRIERTDEQIQKDNENVRVSMSRMRASQSQEARAERNRRQSERREAHRFTVYRRRKNERQRQQERISAEVVTKTEHSQMNASEPIEHANVETWPSEIDIKIESFPSTSFETSSSLQMNASEPIEHVNVETLLSETNIKVEPLPSTSFETSSSETDDPLKILPSDKPKKCILEEKIVTLGRLLAEKSNTVRELQKKNWYQEQQILKLKSVINDLRKREYLRKDAEAEIK